MLSLLWKKLAETTLVRVALVKSLKNVVNPKIPTPTFLKIPKFSPTKAASPRSFLATSPCQKKTKLMNNSLFDIKT